MTMIQEIKELPYKYKLHLDSACYHAFSNPLLARWHAARALCVAQEHRMPHAAHNANELLGLI